MAVLMNDRSAVAAKLLLNAAIDFTKKRFLSDSPVSPVSGDSQVGLFRFKIRNAVVVLSCRFYVLFAKVNA